ncbi:MAG: hypothetical protein RIS71_741, partial [Actinomycetota bacterium]
SGTTYKFYVRAVNAWGNSESSWSNGDPGSSCSSSFSATAPGAPTSLSATAGNGSAEISFTAGSANGATITNYSYSLDGMTFTALSPADASSPVTIPGLTGGTAYTIYLKAINSSGSSSASSSVSVTPLAAAPSVSSVSGTSGTTAGGTSITITGSNFLAGATVTVGGAACTSVNVVSATSITCTTPAGTAGAQNIVVTNTDAQSATLSGGFTYVAAPSAPSTPNLDAASDSGSSNSDDITSDNTPTISVGAATNGNTVTVTATKPGATSVTCTFTATAQSSCDLGTLADGEWSVTSKQTNSGIDSAATAAMSLTIDTTRPTVSSFSSTKANGNYTVGETINITATMSETVADGASITVTLDTGDTVVLTKATGTTLTGTYTVGSGDTSSDLTVSSFVLTSAPTDTAGNSMTSTTVPSGVNNISGSQAIVIDTAVPTLSSASANAAGNQITLTLSETLSATTAATGDFSVSVAGVPVTVSSVTVSGATVILALASNVASGSTIDVAYTAPASNRATSNAAIQDSTGNDVGSFTTTAIVAAATTTTPTPTNTAAPTTTTTSPAVSSGTTTTTVAGSTTTTSLRPIVNTTTTLRSTTTTVRPTTTTVRSTTTLRSTTTTVRASTTAVPTTSALTTTTVRASSTTTSSTTIPQSTLSNLAVAEKSLDSARTESTNNVLSAQIAVAELRLSVMDPKSAIAVAVRDAENELAALIEAGASSGNIATAKQEVQNLKIAVAESRSISVEAIIAARASLEKVLANPRATSAEVAEATATYVESRVLSAEETAKILATFGGDYTRPVFIPSVTDVQGSGNFVLLDGTVERALELRRVNDSVMVLTDGSGFKISIAAVDKDGNPFTFNSRGAVVVKHGNFIAVAGEGFTPSTEAKTWLFSSPRELGALNVDAQGRFSAQYKITRDVRIGDHLAQVTGLGPNGEQRSVTIDVEIQANPGPSPYDPLTQPRNVLVLFAELFTLLAAVGISRRPQDEEERESAEIAEVSVAFADATADRGDDLLSVVALDSIDSATTELPHRLVRFSPMLARVFADGTYLRSLLGVFWLALPLLGIAFGVGAAMNTNFDATMPSLWFLTALVIVGSFDALVGLLGATAFTVAVIAGGGLSSSDSVRGLLGITVFCFGAPLIASATRPFRRIRRDGEQTAWLRTVDFFLVTLFGAWVASSMYSALPGLTGFNSPAAGHTTHVRLVVLATLAVRFALEYGAHSFTPRRLRSLIGGPLGDPVNGQEVVSVCVRTAVFMFVAVVFVGNNWALWLGGALYLVPKLVALVTHKLPNIAPLHRFLPRGIFKVVVMLFIAKAWGGFVANQVDDPASMIMVGFVTLGLPGLAFTALGWCARSSRQWPSTLLTKVLGGMLLAIGVLVVLNVWPVI